MSDLCNCEIPTALAPIVSTQESIGQITRIYFQRTRTSGTENVFTVATEDPTLLATWTAAIAAVDSSKVITSPIMDEFVPTSGGGIEYTGNTANGIPLNLGENPATLVAEFLNKQQSTTIEALKALQCEPTAADGLSVFLVNNCGNIIGQTTDDYTTFKGIPIQMLFIGSVDKFGRETPGSNALKAVVLPNWADNLKIISPSDFNAQTFNL